jgi:putative oxidoreductase
MQQHLKQIPAYLLALVFIAFGAMYFFTEPPKMELNDAQKGFFTAFGGTGYMKAIKVLEIIGGLLLVLPRTRAMGICIIVPIVINIFFYEVFIAKEVSIGAALLVLSILAVYFNKERFTSILKGE